MWAGESPKTRTPAPGNPRVILQGLDLVKRFMMCSELMEMTSWAALLISNSLFQHQPSFTIRERRIK